MKDGRVFIPRDLMALVAKQAHLAGISATRWIVEAVEQRLGVKSASEPRGVWKGDKPRWGAEWAGPQKTSRDS